MKVDNAFDRKLPAMLTKTDYLKFLSCPGEFWLKRNNPELFTDAKDIEALHRFEEGQVFEALARRLSIFNPVDPDIRVKFQRDFETEDLYARSDAVITDAATGEVSIYEIKAALNIKKKHYEDLAFQKYTAELCGIKIAKTFLVTGNKEYIKNGEISADEMFVVTDVTNKVEEILPETASNIARAFEYLNQTPQPNLTEYCGSKLDCTFIRHHFPDLPEYTIFDIAYVSRDNLTELINRGMIDIMRVPPDFQLPARQRRQVDVAQSGNSFIERERIEAAINLVYPICFLDYETLGYAVPLFDGIKPFQQMAFQFSLHILNDLDSEPEHYEFLSDGSSYPCRDLAEKLVDVLSGRVGTVVVWNEKFEKAINKELGAAFPEFADFFEELNEKIFDLMKIFSDHFYVHPRFKGSPSLKSVAPALCPNLSYDELEISKGTAASIHWHWLATQRFDEKRNSEIYADLLKYCELDTRATVEIFKFLKNL